MQHDYNIQNQSGADFRADLNNALSAIATVNSGASEPSTTFAHQLWVDTSNNVLKIRNAANSAFITTGVSITASNTFTGALTGNATTATTLQTARTINGTSFDGSANISFNTDSVAEGSSNLYYTGERVDDQVNNLLVGGSGISLVYDDTNNTLTINGQVGDITGITAGSGLVGGGNSGDVSLAVNVDDASIEIDTDVVKVKASGITNAMLAGSIANSKLINSSVTINSQSLALGGTLVLDTDNIGEGSSNLYYTDARVNSAFDTRLATKDTGDLSEGSNLYYTTARVNSAFDTRLATKDTGDLSEGSNLYFTNERVDDRVSTLIQNGTGISWSYDDASGTFTPTISLSPFNTSQLSESGNLYYTDARARAAISENSAQLSYNSGTGVLTYTQGDTDTVSEGSNNLYYTSARANTDFDTRLATKSTTNLAEGTNLYYTTARFDSAFTSKDTDDLSEGTTNLYYTQSRFDSAFGNKTTANLTENTNLYYTDTRANSAIDARVVKSFVDALGIQATSVADNSVVLGNDTTGNYIQTVTGTANKITVSGSGSESADITLSLPDDVQIASDLTVAGNLTVNGTLTSLDTTNLDIEDNLFQLNAGLTGSPVNDSGMLINRGSSDNGIFMWDESVDKFTLGLTTADGSATGNITLSSLGTLVANLEGSVTGNVTGQVSDISNFTTANLTENTNLYYTQARFDSALAAKSTTNLSEGSNLYYTDARFDTRLASKDTDDVSEGTSNLYYTSARFNSAFSGKSTSDLSEGSNLYYTDARVQAVSINNVVEDTTPQLGGNLDLNSSDITGTGDINITGTITSSGNITGTLATASQPNITSLGTLTSLTGGTGDLNWDSGTLFVDSSANAVGISTTSPVGNLEVIASTIISGASNSVNAVQVGLSGANRTALMIDTADTTHTNRRWNITNIAGDLYLGRFGLDVMSFKNDGSVGIGTTSSISSSSSSSSTGFWFDTADYLAVARNSQRVAIFNRIGTDGEIVAIRKDGTTVGSIGTEGGDMVIGTGDTAVQFADSLDCIRPFTSSGSGNGGRDNAIDLGASGQRFKDLYLSGTAYSNKLEVVDSSGTFGARITNNNDGSEGLLVRCSDNDSNLYILNCQSSSSATGTDYSSKFLVTKSGNVSIGGTLSPSATLHVASQAGSNKSAIITRSSGSEAVNLSEMQAYNALQILNKANGSYLNFAGNASNTQIQAQSDGNTAEDIALNPYGGKVLIGTTSGTGMLNIQSNSDYTRLIELYGSGTSSTSASLRLGISGNNSQVAMIGGVSSGYAGLSFHYYYLTPQIQQSDNNGDLRLGAPSNRFHTVYSVNGVSTSDKRVKEEIENLDIGLDFIKSLKPKKFKYKDKDEEGNYKDGKLEQKNGIKKWGLIAQDVKQALEDNSITEDIGLWSFDKGECNGEIIENQQQLQYQELISPLIKAIQEQQDQIDKLSKEIDKLKKR